MVNLEKLASSFFNNLGGTKTPQLYKLGDRGIRYQGIEIDLEETEHTISLRIHQPEEESQEKSEDFGKYLDAIAQETLMEKDFIPFTMKEEYTSRREGLGDINHQTHGDLHILEVQLVGKDELTEEEALYSCVLKPVLSYASFKDKAREL